MVKTSVASSAAAGTGGGVSDFGVGGAAATGRVENGRGDAGFGADIGVGTGDTGLIEGNGLGAGAGAAAGAGETGLIEGIGFGTGVGAGDTGVIESAGFGAEAGVGAVAIAAGEAGAAALDAACAGATPLGPKTPVTSSGGAAIFCCGRLANAAGPIAAKTCGNGRSINVSS
jgi:hypothetical protein